MKKILSVDANAINSKIIEQDIKVYFDSIDVTFEFFIAENPEHTLNIIRENEIDIIFIDISAKKYDGIKLLKQIREEESEVIEKQSKIVGVTILDDNTYRFEALKHRVYRYIYKPYDNKEIETVLKRLFSKNYYTKEINRIEHFINVADIENNHEEEEKIVADIEIDDLELVSSYQKRHLLHTATEFLALYEGWGFDVEDLNDLELSLNQLMISIIMDNDFESALPDILNILETYNKFLYNFPEFEELSKVVYSMLIVLREIDFEKLESQTMVSKLILTSIQDLVEWKERVFVAQDATDVYYINDPILNSYVQLQDLLA